MSYFSPTKGIINTENSSTTLLTAGSTFTGTWVDVSSYSDISIAVKTDQNGTFTVQFSTDASNIDTTLTRYYRTTQIEAPHIFEVTRKYARVTFTNTSASDQTYFRLQSIVGNRGQLNIPIDSTMSQDYDSISVRPTKYEHEVALGRRQGSIMWNQFGTNEDVDVGTEVIANFGGTFVPMTTARTLSIVSTSTADDGSPVGTGHALLLFMVLMRIAIPKPLL